MRYKQICLAAVMACGVPVAARAQDNVTIPRAEWEKFMKEHEEMKRSLQEMRDFKSKIETAGTNGVGPLAATELEATREMARKSLPGTDKMLLSGYGTAGYTSLNHQDQYFSAQFNPILLWKISDKLLFEGELEMELEDGETSLALELAQLSYVVNDYITFGAGKFLNPMNSFVERYHMGWVNRLPDKPLAVYDGLLPETYVGAQVRGGVPICRTKLNYAAFIANAPKLLTDPTEDGQGMLEWDNFSNEGDHLAYGGHVGFQPFPELEIGYGLHFSEVGPKGAHGVDALLQSVDASYVRDSEKLKGTIRLNAQWVWSNVDRFTYLDEADNPFTFSNNRDGGYAQFAYRPSHVDWTCLRNFEGVFRYDILNQSKTPENFDEQRFTVGLNYWLTPMTVFKAAYQFDDKSAGQNNSGVLLQFATGF